MLWLKKSSSAASNLLNKDSTTEENNFSDNWHEQAGLLGINHNVWPQPTGVKLAYYSAVKEWARETSAGDVELKRTEYFSCRQIAQQNLLTSQDKYRKV